MLCATAGYYYEGFVSIQRAVDLQIMLELAGWSAAAVDVKLRSFPYPPYTDDRFIVVLQLQMPFIIMLSFIVTAPVICRDVVLEKEKKLKVSRFFCPLAGTDRHLQRRTVEPRPTANSPLPKTPHCDKFFFARTLVTEIYTDKKCPFL